MDLTILYELANISKEVHPAVYTLLGVILGATIPLLKDRYDKKPRLSGSIFLVRNETFCYNKNGGMAERLRRRFDKPVGDLSP